MSSLQTGWMVSIPIFAYLVGLIILGAVIGFYNRKKDSLRQKSSDSTEEFYLGERNINGVCLALACVATALSAGTVVGVAGVAYNTGFNWVYVALGLQMALGFVNIGCLGKRWAIIGRRIHAVTILDFLKARYKSDFIVILGGISTIAFMGTFMMSQLQGGARVLQSVTGLDYKYGLIIFCTVILIYTIIGGFRSVVLTDSVQGAFMVFGALALWCFGLKEVGGFSGLFASIKEVDGLLLTIPGPSNHGNTIMAISYAMHICTCMVVIPSLAQRAFTYPTSKDMHKAVNVGAIVCYVIGISYGFFALVARVLIPAIDNSDMAIPQLYQYLFSPVVAGILIASPFAAMLSTVDSTLLALASTISKDLYKNYIKPKATEKQMMAINYGSIAVLLIGFTAIAWNPPSAVQWVVQFGLGGIGSTFAPILIGGLFWKRANKTGAICGMLAGMAFFIVTTVSTDWALMKQAPAILVGFVVFYIVSKLTAPPDPETIELFWGAYPVEVKK